MTRLARALVLFALVVAGLAASASEAYATHFRYGSITWTTPNPAQPNVITVRFDSAWRRSFFSPAPTVTPPNGPFNVGSMHVFRASDNVLIMSFAVNVTPTAITPADDYFSGVWTQTVTLPTIIGADYRLRFEGCCRVSTLVDANRDQNFYVESRVTIRNPINRPPTSSSLPVVYTSVNQMMSYLIPAFDPDGDALTFALTPLAESGLVIQAPPGSPAMTVTPQGQVTWRPTTVGLYAVQFKVTDSKGASTAIDVIYQVLSTPPSTPATLTINGQPTPATFSVVRGTPMNFSVQTATNSSPPSPVTLNSGPLPLGANMSPSLPTSGTPSAISLFRWTPALNQLGSYIVTFVGSLSNGQQTIGTATINVTNTPPTLTCTPNGGLIEAGPPSPGGANFTVSSALADADGDPLVYQVFIDGIQRAQINSAPASPPPFSMFFPVSTANHTYEVRVSDSISPAVSCSGTFRVADTTAPTLFLPDDAVLDGSGLAGAVHSFTVTATDTVDGSVPVTCTRTSGSAFFYGTTLVECTAPDGAGNIATGSFTVTVNDQTPPVVSYAITGTLGNNDWYTSDVTVTWTVDEPDSGLSSTSGCDPTVLSADTDAIGVTYTCAAANNRGGSTDVTTTAIKRDATPPTVAFAVASVIAEATSAAGAAVTFDAATISDALSGIATSSCTHTSGDTFGLGTTEVRCDATDNAGNSVFAVLSITVEDTTDPLIVALVGGNIEATSPAGATLNFATPGATDAVDASVTVICSPAAGSPIGFAATTVTCTATDDAGNSSSTSAVFAAVDTIAPAIASPGNQTATGTDPSGAAVSWAISATDAATATVVVTCTPASGSTFPYGDTTVTCTAPDDHGNTATATFLVTVNDLTPPLITPTITGTLGANDWYTSDVTVSWAVSDPDSTISSSTGCTTTTTTTDGASFSFTCSATSAGGTTSQTVTFKRDATGPTVAAPANQSVAAESSAGADVDYPAATAQDPVSGVGAVTCMPASGSTFPIGTTTVTCSATNGAGLTGSATFTVTVTDRTEPGKMYGQGDVRTADNHSLKFNFVVLESRRGFEWGDVDIKVKELRRRGGDIDRFDARTVDDVRFTNSPDYGPGRNSHTGVDTVQFSGTGKWEGRSGYRYVVNASDRGEPGRGRDTFTIQIVKISTGEVVFSGGGTLSDGNVQSTRLQKPWWWWTNHRDRDDDRGRGRGRGDR